MLCILASQDINCGCDIITTAQPHHTNISYLHLSRGSLQLAAYFIYSTLPFFAICSSPSHPSSGHKLCTACFIVLPPGIVDCSQTGVPNYVLSNMATFRRFRPDDVNKFSKCNLDPFTETYELNFYLQYHAKWPSLFQVCEDMDGNIVGYSGVNPGLL
jgi:hypothetical protein